MKQCPFNLGDRVIYRPTIRGRGHLKMTDLAVLVPGSSYTVSRIDNEVYVVVKGFENAVPCGIYWTEFESDITASPASN